MEPMAVEPTTATSSAACSSETWIADGPSSDMDIGIMEEKIDWKMLAKLMFGRGYH